MSMRRRRTLDCRSRGCENVVFMGGLCKDHFEESEIKRRRRRDAIDTLHRRIIDGQLPQNLILKDELASLCPWWDRACMAVNSRRSVDMLPFDEANDAVEWCISVAEGIIDQERTFRENGRFDPTAAAFRQWAWDRFAYLEKGLRSNGTPRVN